MPNRDEQGKVTTAPIPPRRLGLSVEMSAEAITAIAMREGWEFYAVAEDNVEAVDVWIENATLIQLLQPALAAAYRAQFGGAEHHSVLQPSH